MKKYLIAFMLALPLGMTAQDNTWERVETEPVQKENRDAKYLVKDAVPEIDGKVCFHQTIEAPGKSAAQIYDILRDQLEKMVNEPNQIENSIVALADAEKHELGAAFHEWLVFKNAALALDRTKFNFQIIVKCEDGKADVKLTRISYDYDTNRKPVHYVAEEWITDKYAVNKKHTKLYPISGKFRRKTIDRANFIFNKFSTLLNEK
jgi:colicin import membrane protein